MQQFVVQQRDIVPQGLVAEVPGLVVPRRGGQAELSLAMILDGNRSINTGNGHSLTISGVISETGGSRSLTKTGAGTLTLSGTTANTYTGLTTVNDGTLTLTATTALSGTGGNYEINNGALLQSTVAINIGVRTITFGASGGSINIGGNLRVNSSRFVTTGGPTSYITGSLIDLGTPTYDVADGPDAVDLQVANKINRGGIVKDGAGTLRLTNTANNLQSNPINIIAGVLELGGAGRLVSGNYSANITNDGIFRHNSSSNQTLNGVISGTGAIEKDNGASTLTLTATNTYAGNTTVNAGKLALSGGGKITNSASIGVASNAVFDVSGLSSAFTLAQALSSQTLSNSAPGAIINGTNNCSAGTISLVYDGVNPCFTLTNGVMTLSAATTIKVNNTGALLAHSTNRIIAKATSGNVGLVAGSLPAVTVSGGGAALPVSLQLVSGELYLNVNNAPVARNVTNSVVQGGSITITNNPGKNPFATDADGDSLTIISVSASLGSVGTYDSISFTVADNYGGTNSAVVAVGIESATGANLVSATAGDVNAYLSYAAYPGYNYALDKATSIDPPITWVPQVTNTADGSGRLNYTNLLSTWPTNDFFRTRYVP